MGASDQLLFLNFTNPPTEAQQKSNRKQVRSWVTTKQHRSRNDRSRETTTLYLRPSTSGLRSPDEAPPVSRDLFDHLHHVVASRSAFQHPEIFCHPMQTPSSPLPLEWRMAHIQRNETQSSRRKPGDNAHNPPLKWLETREGTTWMHKDRTETNTSGDDSTTFYEESLLLLQYSLEDPTDELNKSCKRLGQSMADSLGILSNLVHALGPDLERKLDIQPGLTAKYMLPMVLSDPALLAVTTLKCATMICQLQNLSLKPLALLELRQYALERIRRALDHFEDGISDELLCAVSTLANYELVHNGNRELYHAHKEGLVKLIALRGGLEALGHEGYTQSTLVYNDANTAKLAGCRPHLSVFRKVTEDMDAEFWLQGVSMATEERDDSLDFVEQSTVAESSADGGG